MRGILVEKQIQWILSYVQRELADIQKNLLEDLELGKAEFRLAGEFLLELKKEFEGEENFKEQPKKVDMKEEHWWRNLKEG